MANRFESIDTLRFIAAYSVCFAHLIPITNTNLIISEFFLGKFGVVIFFMISGYLIPSSIKIEKNGLKKFWVSRFFRLYPMYWISILIAITLMNFDKNTILFNLTMFQSLFGYKDILGVYWTLIIEMFFYIFCSILLILKILHKPNFIFLSTIGFVFISIIISFLRYKTEKALPLAVPLLMTVMMIGYNLKLYEKKIVKKNHVIFLNIVFFISLPFICYYGYSIKDNLTGDSIEYITSYTLGIFTFYFFYKYKISINTISKLGTHTYSAYLIHPLIITIIIITDFKSQSNFLIYFTYFSSIVLLSYVFFKLIEKPFIDIGKSINKQ